jgi:uroporphyrinogen decarboxylase
LSIELIKVQKKILRVLEGERISPPPIWLMRQAGRYLPEYRSLREKCPNFIEFCLKPELTVLATMQPLDRYDLDAAIIFSDILILPYALGQKVVFHEGKGPCLSPIKSEEDFLKLTTEFLQERLSPVLSALREVRSLLPSEKTLIGFAGAPWTIFAYMTEGKTSRTFSHAIELFYHNPHLAQRLLDLICKATEEYLEQQIIAGAEVIQLFDSWAGTIPYSLVPSLLYEPTQRLLLFLKRKFPHVPVICFPKGIGEKIPFYLKSTQARAISLDANVDLESILPYVPPYTVIQGALDPHVLVAGGAILDTQLLRLKEIFSDYPYIFNLGHGILPYTPPENITQLINTLRYRE